jgi:hypothetical protein
MPVWNYHNETPLTTDTCYNKKYNKTFKIIKHLLILTEPQSQGQTPSDQVREIPVFLGLQCSSEPDRPRPQSSDFRLLRIESLPGAALPTTMKSKETEQAPGRWGIQPWISLSFSVSQFPYLQPEFWNRCP